MYALNLQKHALEVTEFHTKAIIKSQTTIGAKMTKLADLVVAAPIASEEDIEACKGGELPPPPPRLDLDSEAIDMNSEMFQMHNMLEESEDDMDSLFSLDEALASADADE